MPRIMRLSPVGKIARDFLSDMQILPAYSGSHSIYRHRIFIVFSGMEKYGSSDKFDVD